MFEKAHMLRSPTLEVEYAHDERSPLGLYDCLIPKLREHRKLSLPPEIYYSTQNLMDDIRAKQKVLSLELELKQNNLPKYQRKLEKAKKKAHQLKKETQIIDWLSKAVESNFILDAGNILEEFDELKITHQKLKRQSQQEIT